MKEQEFTILAQRILDGEASDAEQSSLNSLLETDSKWKKIFESLQTAHFLLDRLEEVGKKNKRAEEENLQKSISIIHQLIEEDTREAKETRLAIFPPTERLKAAAKSESEQLPNKPFYFEVAGRKDFVLRLQRTPDDRFTAIVEHSDGMSAHGFTGWELIVQLKDGNTQEVGKLIDDEIIRFSLSEEGQPLPVYIRKDGEQINLNFRVD